MNRQHNYLLVEGPQDVFFVGRILEQLGFHSADSALEIPEKWRPFLDAEAVKRDEALRASQRGNVPFWQIFKPACLYNLTHCVVIEAVGGNRAKFSRTLRATDKLIDGQLASLTGVGVLPDADADPAASLASALQALESARLSIPTLNQEVVPGPPNTGVFVFPGADGCGGLEELLIDCGEEVYPNLIAGARGFVDGVDLEDPSLTGEDLEGLRTPQGPAKAIVGSVASVLKPGSTIQVSVLRDRWVSDATLAIPRIAALVTFLKTLCEID